MPVTNPFVSSASTVKPAVTSSPSELDWKGKIDAALDAYSKSIPMRGNADRQTYLNTALLGRMNERPINVGGGGAWSKEYKDYINGLNQQDIIDYLTKLGYLKSGEVDEMKRSAIENAKGSGISYDKEFDKLIRTKALGYGEWLGYNGNQHSNWTTTGTQQPGEKEMFDSAMANLMVGRNGIEAIGTAPTVAPPVANTAAPAATNTIAKVTDPSTWLGTITGQNTTNSTRIRNPLGGEDWTAGIFGGANKTSVASPFTASTRSVKSPFTNYSQMYNYQR